MPSRVSTPSMTSPMFVLAAAGLAGDLEVDGPARLRYGRDVGLVVAGVAEQVFYAVLLILLEVEELVRTCQWMATRL